MVELQKLDSMLEKLVNITEIELDKAIEKKFFGKDLAEAVSIVLSVAYERIGSSGK